MRVYKLERYGENMLNKLNFENKIERSFKKGAGFSNVQVNCTLQNYS